ncbi:Protein of unknown function [Rubritalea squalenifaciens DSM 18772]|uniref:DUF2971 domain-containing protein n=1 Tax=Rubritalea squalenifaciens DSM 18772 TaxID=1123071 RepID=A0A1M6D4H1_9BACT|nr:DUF2971 domain-containing protein [Rubritalea squalenifaciens]SHI67898.1 Protein of unknown function [Rubritalea squalenifaciens DSM 18772]
MFLFKYQSPSNLSFSALKRGEIYFASVGELNDSNECRPNFIYKASLEIWQRFAHFILFEIAIAGEHVLFGGNREKFEQFVDLYDEIGAEVKKSAGLRELSEDNLIGLFIKVMLGNVAGSYPENQLRYLEELSFAVLKEKLPDINDVDRYIAAFSTDVTNPTMWGHYGAADQGFAIVYEVDGNKLSVSSSLEILYGSRPSEEEGVSLIGAWTDKDLELEPVTYKKSPPKVNGFHYLVHKFHYSEAEYHYDVPELIMGDAPLKDDHLVGLVKYSDWRYEREVRAILPKYGKRNFPPDLRSLKVSPKHVKGIVLGSKISNADAQRVFFCCYMLVSEYAKNAGEEYDLESFSFFQAKAHQFEFKMTIKPLGVLKKSYMGSLPFKPLCELEIPHQKLLQDKAAILGNGNVVT